MKRVEQFRIKGCEDGMPEYLKFDTAFTDLDLAAAEDRLEEQLRLLREAVVRLHEADRVRAEIFDYVVSV